MCKQFRLFYQDFHRIVSIFFRKIATKNLSIKLTSEKNNLNTFNTLLEGAEFLVLSHAYVWQCASHQVLCEVIDELSVVQALVIVEVVLKHGRDLLWSHHRSTHSHWILTRLDRCKNNIHINAKQCLPCSVKVYLLNKAVMKVFMCVHGHCLLYLDHLWVWVNQV